MPFMAKASLLWLGPVLSGSGILLSTETELLDDASVSLDILFLEVIKETASLTNELKK